MSDPLKHQCDLVTFHGVTVQTGDYVCKHVVRQQIMTQAARVVQTQLHLPMFFAFFPGVAHVFYLVHPDTGEFMIAPGLQTFINYTKRHRPYRVAFVAEGIWEREQPGNAATPAISLTVQSPTEQDYYVHALLADTAGRRHLSHLIVNSDLGPRGGGHALGAPVDFYHQPTRDLLN